MKNLNVFPGDDEAGVLLLNRNELLDEREVNGERGHQRHTQHEDDYGDLVSDPQPSPAPGYERHRWRPLHHRCLH